MCGMNKYLAGRALSLALLFLTTSMSKAMETSDFDTLSDANKVNYMAFLVEGTSDSFKAQGKADDAKKLIDLFTTLAADQKGSIGAEAFFAQVNSARDYNKRHPNNTIEMEQIFLMVLNKFNLDTDLGALETLSSNFKPSVPK
jgi:hypothetical protein